MPTYTFRCHECGARAELVMSISRYIHEPPNPQHCGQFMERSIEVAPGMALHNAQFNDRHYEGLRAQDGSDISSRAKHRQYMKDHNLTTVDDFKDTWAKQARERQERLDGKDASRAQDIANAIHKLGG